MVGLTLTTALALISAEARQNELFRSWEKAKADMHSLVVEFTHERNDRGRNEIVKFRGTFKLLRTAQGDLFASYTVTPTERPGTAAGGTIVGLLNGGKLYVLDTDSKRAIRYVPERGDVRLFLEKRFLPFALLLDERHAREKYRLGIAKQDKWYSYLNVEPKQLPSGWMPDVLQRGRVVFMNADSKSVPKDMPRQLWYEEVGRFTNTYDIRSWKANSADGPKAEEFTRPEDRPGWEVQEWKWPVLNGTMQRKDERGSTRKVGQIYIVGNAVTYDSAYLDRLHLYPGSSFTETDRRRAEQKLAPLALLGIRCSVTPLDREGDAEYVDVLVRAEESPVTQVFGRIYNHLDALQGQVLLMGLRWREFVQRSHAVIPNPAPTPPVHRALPGCDPAAPPPG